MPWARAILPAAIVFAGGVGTLALVSARPVVPTEPPAVPLPLVEVIPARPRSVQLTVRSQGSVVPRTESELVAEVSGRIVEVASDLAPGGFFEEGDLLLRIDPSDYHVAVERAEAHRARAGSEQELAAAARARAESLAMRGVTSQAALDQARAAERVAGAALRDATAQLEQARRELVRTRIVAPFAGRVREQRVGLGQFVRRGAAVARVYAVDYAEVRLPIPDADAAYVDLPIAYRDAHPDATGPEVRLRARFAGRDYSWTGRIVRTEGELDPRTRMIHAVARVEDPYGHNEDPERPPLAVGLFVEAEILGRSVDDVVVIPRAALRERNRVAVVDTDSRLRLRSVEVLRLERDRVLLRSGLEASDRICVSPLPLQIDGMKVRTAAPTTAGPEAAS